MDPGIENKHQRDQKKKISLFLLQDQQKKKKIENKHKREGIAFDKGEISSLRDHNKTKVGLRFCPLETPF